MSAVVDGRAGGESQGRDIDELIIIVAEMLVAAGEISVLSGAGLSAESGIPTFRDAEDGVWSNITGKIGLAMFGTPWGWNWIPSMAWKAYKTFQRPILAAQPNPGHLALGELQAMKIAEGGKFNVMTQNVDNLHQRGGSNDVIELHGSVYRTKCVKEGHPMGAESADNSRCAVCGSRPRPDCVLYTEGLDDATWERARSAVTSTGNRKGVILVVGTSGIVQPACSLPEIGKRAGAMIVEINRDPTDITRNCDFVLRGASGNLLPRILDAYKGMTG